MIAPTPVPELEARQFTIPNIFGSSTDSSSSSNNGNGGTTTSSSSSSSTSSSSSSSTSQSSSTSTSARETTRTTSTQATFVSSATSNGVIVQTTITTGQGVTVVATAPASTSTAKNESSGSSNGGLIGGVVGGVVGGLALLTLLALILLLWRRRKARTGHGWFLCFGRKPAPGGMDVDWPTFDPTAGAAGVGGTFGDAGAMGGSGRGRNSAYGQGTLPAVDGDEGAYHDAYPYDDMREVGSAGGLSGAGAAGAYTTSDGSNTHYRQNSQTWGASPIASYSQAHQSNPSHYDAQQNSAPDYSHLDAPEVREQRMREQQALAAAQAAAGGSPPPTSHNYTATSPSNGGSPPLYSPPTRPMSTGAGQAANNEHRFSQGTAQMLADNNFFDQDAGTGTYYADDSDRPRLQLHNPDA